MESKWEEIDNFTDRLPVNAGYVYRVTMYENGVPTTALCFVPKYLPDDFHCSECCGQ